MTLGERIQHYRKQKNMKQSELADLLGISRSYISMIENDKIQPDTEILKNISNSLDIPMDNLDNDIEVSQTTIKLLNVIIEKTNECKLNWNNLNNANDTANIIFKELKNQYNSINIAENDNVWCSFQIDTDGSYTDFYTLITNQNHSTTIFVISHLKATNYAEYIDSAEFNFTGIPLNYEVTDSFVIDSCAYMPTLTKLLSAVEYNSNNAKRDIYFKSLIDKLSNDDIPF